MTISNPESFKYMTLNIDAVMRNKADGALEQPLYRNVVHN